MYKKTIQSFDFRSIQEPGLNEQQLVFKNDKKLKFPDL